VKSLLKHNKVISLLPDAIEILFGLKLDGILHGVTHKCSFPIEASDKTRIICSSFDVDTLNSVEIDKKYEICH
jgi:hypothetical protein